MKKGSKISEETRIKMSLARTGEKNHRFDKHCSEETKLKISQANKGKSTGKNPNKSHPHTEEWKKQHSDQMMGAGSSRATAITLPNLFPSGGAFILFLCEAYRRNKKLWTPDKKLILPKDLGFSY